MTGILKVCSMFSGAGGADLGFVGGFDHLGIRFDPLPYKIVWANDIDPDAAMTYRANQEKYLGSHRFHEGDVRLVDPSLVPDFDVLVAGFPCQPFSNAGKRLGVDDERGNLFREVQRFIAEKAPLAFVLENVKGILSTKMPDGTPLPEEIRKRLSHVRMSRGGHVGYRVTEAKLLKSDHFGVPQQRHRVLIVGIREDVGGGFDFEAIKKHVHPKSLEKLSLKHVLDNVPEKPEEREVWGFSPQAKKLVPLIRRSWKDIPYELLPPRFQRIRDQMERYRSPNFYRRFGMDEVNGTITASAQPENCGIIHPVEHRRFSVREIARIQSFPDDYVFEGRSVSEKYKVIGNAVPPVMAHALAKALYEHVTSGLSVIPNDKVAGEKRNRKTVLALQKNNGNDDSVTSSKTPTYSQAIASDRRQVVRNVRREETLR